VSTRSRSLSSLTGLGFGAAALVLSGCSTDLHPGMAAIVDGTTITQGSIDDLVDAACVYTKEYRKQDDRVQPVKLADIRASFVTGEVQSAITQNVADDLGLTVGQAQVEETAVQSVNSIPDSVPDDDRDVLTDYFDKQAETSILQAVIGKHQQDDSVTDGSQVTSDEIQATKPFMKPYFEKADVDVNPSYGQWNGSTLDKGTGSLSLQVSTPSAIPTGIDQCG
jgi:hypothetical protein